MGGSHISAFTLARSLVSDFGVRCILLAAADTPIAKEAGRLGLEVQPSEEYGFSDSGYFYGSLAKYHSS
jgi:hypothetical protein